MIDAASVITIAMGQSVSGAVDLGTAFALGFIVPHVVEATTAQLSFQASDSLAGTYRTVKVGGTKLTLPIAIDDHALLSSMSDLVGVRFLKIVAETAGGVAVVQATQKDDFLVIKYAAI
jgi:hypothetical protein